MNVSDIRPPATPERIRSVRRKDENQVSKYREVEPLKKGDRVVMHTCIEARNTKYYGKVWTCKTDEYSTGEGAYKQNLVFLEGFSGCFLTDYLQKVNIDPTE